MSSDVFMVLITLLLRRLSAGLMHLYNNIEKEEHNRVAHGYTSTTFDDIPGDCGLLYDTTLSQI